MSFSMKKPILFESDNLFREIAPLNKSTVPATTVATGTCTGRLFDDSKDSTIKLAVSSGTSIEVEDAKVFDVGDTIYVKLDSTVWHDAGPLVSKVETTGAMVITNAIPSAVTARRYVSVKLGADIAMPTYGTPALNTRTWGYGGIITDLHADLYVGQKIRAETIIAAGADQTLTKNYHTYVKGRN